MMRFKILSILFNCTSFSKRVKAMSESELVTAFEDAINRQNFELAAYLKYYLDFKYKRSVCKLV